MRPGGPVLLAGQNKITRRHLLALSGGAIGATVLACCSLTTLGMQQPALESRNQVVDWVPGLCAVAECDMMTFKIMATATLR